jgi:hypothetical protein
MDAFDILVAIATGQAHDTVKQIHDWFAAFSFQGWTAAYVAIGGAVCWLVAKL